MRASVWLVGAAFAALAVTGTAGSLFRAVAQETNGAAPAPSPSPPAAEPAPEPAAAAPATAPTRRQPAAPDELPDLFDIAMPPPPVEIPDDARRDPRMVGALDPADVGLAAGPWRGASGAFLSTLMRQMDTPLASRWTHIALRNLLLARTPAPRNVNPVDWVGERAWLLLRMGEADAARMLVAGVDVDQFTPKMFQVGVQSALANADPSALCPLQEGIEDVEPQIYQLVDAMCAALAGESETASSQIDSARRRGRMNPIDITLAQKVVGAASSETGRAVTVEWEPVERLNAWRFGLATATGMLPPERLIADAPLQLRAWQAQAPLLAPADRLESARIATAMGVLSSQSMIDLHSLIYDSTGPDDLAETDAWQLRIAYAARDQADRLEAMRRLWSGASGPLETLAARAMLGRAAARIVPSADLVGDSDELIASMLAAGLDRDAARWAPAVAEMDEAESDAAWMMLALSAPSGVDVDRSAGRIEDFIDRDNSPQRKRSALLVAGLAGLGHIDAATASRFNARHGLRLAHRSRWTRMIDRAAELGQPGTVLVMTGTGMQAPSFQSVPPSHLFHALAALKRTGQDFTARMIAAEALSRT